MGHKGVSKRKLPKEKLKPSATANHSSGLVSDLSKPEGVPGQLSEKARGMPSGKGGMYPSTGSKKGQKKH